MPSAYSQLVNVEGMWCLMYKEKKGKKKCCTLWNTRVDGEKRLINEFVTDCFANVLVINTCEEQMNLHWSFQITKKLFVVKISILTGLDLLTRTEITKRTRCVASGSSMKRDDWYANYRVSSRKSHDCNLWREQFSKVQFKSIKLFMHLEPWISNIHAIEDILNRNRTCTKNVWKHATPRRLDFRASLGFNTAVFGLFKNLARYKTREQLYSRCVNENVNK